MDDEIMNEANDDVREDETVDEIRDNDYVNDDEVEMDRSIEEKLNTLFDKIDGFSAKLDSIYDTVSMFVDSGAVIREDANGITETDDDFADEFMTIDELDFSLD